MNLVCIEEEEEGVDEPPSVSYAEVSMLPWGTVCKCSTQRAQHFPRRMKAMRNSGWRRRSEQHDKGRRTAAFSHVKGRRWKRWKWYGIVLLSHKAEQNQWEGCSIKLTGMPQKKFLEMRLIQQWVHLPENTGVTLYWILSGDGITHHLSDEQQENYQTLVHVTTDDSENSKISWVQWGKI